MNKLISITEYKGEFKEGDKFYTASGIEVGRFTGFENPFGLEIRTSKGNFFDLDKGRSDIYITATNAPMTNDSMTKI